MTAVLVAAGQRVISTDDVRRLVAEPDSSSSSLHQHDIYIVPSHGLYLASVDYDDRGLISIFYHFLPQSHFSHSISWLTRHHPLPYMDANYATGSIQLLFANHTQPAVVVD